jgi:G3E family GTPase
VTKTVPLPNATDYLRAHGSLDVLIGMVETAAIVKNRPEKVGAAIPIVIISGFLGAGKTTLMRHLLTDPNGLRIAVLVNDLSALNIDAELIREVSGDTTELQNGCICCSLSGTAARSLIKISEREKKPDIILVECSGVTDPWPVAQVISAIPGIYLDSIVTVVDAADVEWTQADISAVINPLNLNQILAADLILLNKTDLVLDPVLEHTVGWIKKVSPRAQVLRVQGCAVPRSIIFANSRTREEVLQKPVLNKSEGFSSAFLTFDHPISRADLEKKIETLPDGILRIKGYVQLVDTEHRMVLQAVGRRWRWHRAEKDGNENCLVVIGLSSAMTPQGLNQHFFGAGLRVTELAGAQD